MSNPYSLNITLSLPRVKEASEKQVTQPEELAQVCRDVGNLAQEAFIVVTMNTKNRVIDVHLCSLGTLDSSPVDPRVVFRYALLDGASAVAFIHNHPSGDTTPSSEDRAIASRLKDGCKLLNLRFLDFLIAGPDKFYSWEAQS